LEATERQKDAVAFVTITGLTLAIYWSTMCPTVYWYDSAEFAAAAHTLGIPHPPGYPLYTLVGHLFSYLPGDPAWRINFFSAVSAAIAVGLSYYVVRKLGARGSGAVVSAAFVATGPIFWFNALIAEVYAPALATLMGVLLLLFRGLERDDGRWTIGAAFLAGLGLGFHMGIATCGLGLVVLVLGLGVGDRLRGGLWSRRDLRRRIRVAVGAAAAAGAGSCIFLWLPIRASMSPKLNFGNPATWERFSWSITGGNYKGWFGDSYELGARATWLADLFVAQLSVVGLVLAVVGFAWLARKRPLLALAWGLAIAGNVWFFFDYLVHDAEVFFLPAYVLTACLAGLSMEWLSTAPRWARPVAVAAAGLIVVFNFVSSFNQVDLGGVTEARDWGETACAELPQEAIIVNYTTPPEWKLDMVFSAYFQTTLDRRPDVHVVSMPPPVAIFQWAAAGHAVYAYAPVPLLAADFELAPEAGLFRIVRPRPRPAPPDAGTGAVGP
jgi:hypothetical protein